MRIFCIENDAKEIILVNLFLKKLNKLKHLRKIMFLEWNLYKKRSYKLHSYKMSFDSIYRDNLAFSISVLFASEFASVPEFIV